MTAANDAGGTGLAAAIAAIDAVNAGDPRLVDGRPQAQVEGERAVAWVARLRPDAPEALVLAARAHHLRRWAIPRSDFPTGRDGYLRWRRRLHALHAEEVAPLLRGAGYDDATVERVQFLVRKRGLGRDERDPDAQTLEDAVCCVFLETELEAFRARLGDDAKLVDVIRKTLPKMSDEGRQAALALDLPPAAAAVVAEAAQPG